MEFLFHLTEVYAELNRKETAANQRLHRLVWNQIQRRNPHEILMKRQGERERILSEWSELIGAYHSLPKRPGVAQ